MNRTVAGVILALLCSASTSLFAQIPTAPPWHDIEVTLTSGNGEIRVSDRITLDGRERFRFGLAHWLEIEALSVDGVGASVTRQDGGYLVELPDSGRHQLDFKLRGTVPPRDAGQGRDAGMLASSGDDGVYLPAYDAWIPDEGGASIRYRLKVGIAATRRAVATAKLIDEKVDGGRYQASFEQSHAGEAPSLFTGPYQVRERLVDGLRLRTYFHAELAELSDIYLDAANAYIQRYRRQIGDYPYADFHVISAPLPVGLGFPNLTYVGRRVIPLPFMRGRSLAHEVLHNWWGNGVAVDYASGNWAEGLTTFMADYALERDKSAAAARSMRIKWLRDYAALPPGRDLPVRAFRSRRHQASQVIGYDKVAFIFHMLTREIGRPAFDAGLRRFWNWHKYRGAGWRDLQAAFEAAAGRDLGWFFRQWLDRPGAPRISIGAHSLTRVDEGFRLDVEIIQPIAGYRFGLPVLLTTDDGFERHEIRVSETLTRVEWITSARPRSIHFDPDNDVFRLLRKSETPPILRDITLDPAATAMIGAGNEEFAGVARALAAGLMDVEARFAELALDRTIERPLLLITTTDRLHQQLAQLGLQQPAGLPAAEYSAAAWTARLANGVPILVVSADNVAELRALLRPLPHYGGQSYVLFETGRARDRGIWPVKRGALFLEFD
ncbi:MAG: M1 family metallopeptidase [Gammaproteobacteria bacterium]|nr:M1 family metallopeptidase [Gammaproteobacteria bacterium]